MEELEAGPELDALVAERVFGWQRWETFSDQARTRPVTKWMVTDRRWPAERVPSYSSDIAAAWQVVERMIDGDYDTAKRFTAAFDGVGPSWWAYRAPGMARAICRAALAALDTAAECP